jgi:hypothetical protein
VVKAEPWCIGETEAGNAEIHWPLSLALLERTEITLGNRGNARLTIRTFSKVWPELETPDESI